MKRLLWRILALYDHIRSTFMARGTEFTELFTLSHTVSTINTWEDWDLSSLVPAKTKEVFIVIQSYGAYVMGARKKGSSENRFWILGSTGLATALALATECDADRIVQIRASHATSVSFKLAGYRK